MEEAMRNAVSALIAVALAFGASSAFAAAPCKDAKGRFTKCPAPAVASARCKDAHGKFAKCGSPGAKPVG
jgi:hypothetical protein